MDRDGVDAEVLYPTPRLSQAIVANHDVEYHEAMVRAYNDWLSEYVEYAPGALRRPRMLSPTAASRARVAEIDRVRRPARHPRVRDGLLPERHARARRPTTTRSGRTSRSSASR